MNETPKTRLLDQFASYLEKAELEPSAQTCDLHTLFTEMAALRTEVKIQARQFKTAIEDYREANDVLQRANERLSEVLDASKVNTSRDFLLQLLEVYDRLAVGAKQLQRYEPVSKVFRRSKKHDMEFIQSVQEGQGIALRRVEQILLKYRVTPIDVINLPVDPQVMKVVEIDHQCELEDGIVTGELRRGFRWQAQILRLAEVRVNKRGSQ